MGTNSTVERPRIRRPPARFCWSCVAASWARTPGVRWPDPVGGRLLWAAGGRRTRRHPRRHGARSPDRSRSDQLPRGRRRAGRTDDGRWRSDFGGDPRAQLPDGRLRGGQDGSVRRLAAGFRDLAAESVLGLRRRDNRLDRRRTTRPGRLDHFAEQPDQRGTVTSGRRGDRAGPGRGPAGRGSRWRLARRPFPPRRRPGGDRGVRGGPPPDPAGESDDQLESDTEPRRKQDQVA